MSGKYGCSSCGGCGVLFARLKTNPACEYQFRCNRCGSSGSIPEWRFEFEKTYELTTVAALSKMAGSIAREKADATRKLVESRSLPVVEAPEMGDAWEEDSFDEGRLGQPRDSAPSKSNRMIPPVDW